jgi:hypothetical protein
MSDCASALTTFITVNLLMCVWDKLRVSYSWNDNARDVDRPVANLTLCQKGVYFTGIKLYSSLSFKIKWLFANSKQFKITPKEFLMTDFYYTCLHSVHTRKWVTDYNQGQTHNSVHIFMLYICVYTLTSASVYWNTDKLLNSLRYTIIYFVCCRMFVVICFVTFFLECLLQGVFCTLFFPHMNY